MGWRMPKGPWFSCVTPVHSHYYTSDLGFLKEKRHKEKKEEKHSSDPSAQFQRCFLWEIQGKESENEPLQTQGSF